MAVFFYLDLNVNMCHIAVCMTLLEGKSSPNVREDSRLPSPLDLSHPRPLAVGEAARLSSAISGHQIMAAALSSPRQKDR